MKKARVRLAPINTGLYAQGNSTQKNNIFFRNRAKGGVDLCMVGNIAITQNNVPNVSTGVMSENSCWSNLANVIKSERSIPAIQLSSTLPGYKGLRTFYTQNTEKEMQRYKTIFNQMTESNWEDLGRKFTKAIELSWSHGFEHVQLHAAHGYAFSLVLDNKINPEKRGFNVLISLLKLLSSYKNKSASMRISWYTGLPYDDERQLRIIEIWRPFKNQIELDISNGYYNIDKRYIYPPHKKGEAPFLDQSISLANRFPSASFVISGNIWNPFTLINKTPVNLNFALARPLIADPYYLIYIKTKKLSHMACDDCGMCHFFSKGKKHISCPKW